MYPKIIILPKCISVIFLVFFLQKANATYTVTDNDVIVKNGIITKCNYSGSETLATIPEVLDGQTVVGVNYGVFKTASIEAIVLPELNSPNYQGWRNDDNVLYSHEDTITKLNGSYSAIIPYVLTNSDVVVADGMIISCSYSFDLKDIIIPDILDGQAITGIADGVFSYKGIRSVYFPATLKTIGNGAFSGYELFNHNLEACHVLERIGDDAFSGNKISIVSLASEMFTYIGDGAFGYNMIGNLALSNSAKLEYIGNSAFNSNDIKTLDISGCTALEEIGDEAFYGCPISKLNLSGAESLMKIGASAFRNGALESLDLSKCTALKTIGDNAFTANKLSALNINSCSKLTSIGEAAFYDNNIDAVAIDKCSSLTFIGEYAFASNHLISIVLPLPSYGAYAGWQSGDGIAYVAGDEITTLDVLYTIGSDDPHTLADYDVVVENGEIISCSYNYLAKNIIIPSTLDNQTVTSIGSNVFRNKEIASIVLPGTIETIKQSAFAQNQIASLNLSDCPSLVEIGDDAFAENKIESLDLSKSSKLTTIGAGAFYLNGVEQLDLTFCTSLTVIGTNAFCANGMDALTISNCSSLEVIGASAFFGNNLGKLDFANCTSLKRIGNRAFGNNGLTGINFAHCSSMTFIGDSAFLYYKNKIISLDLSSCTALDTIGSFAFFASSIDTLNIDCPKLAYIGEGAFGENNLATLDFSTCATLTTIGKEAFAEIESLDELDLSACTNLETIGDMAFYEASLETLDLSGLSKLAVIGNKAFYKNSITSLNLSNCSGLQIIGNQAFYWNHIRNVNFSNCTSLKAIEYSAFSENSISTLDLSDCINLKILGSSAFYDNKIKVVDLRQNKQLAKIGGTAFYGEQYLTSINISNCSSLLFIGWKAFGWYSEGNSTTFTLPATTVYPASQGWQDSDGNSFALGARVANLSTSYQANLGAYTLTDDDVVVEDGYIISCSYDMLELSDIIIPQTLDGQEVIGIGDDDVFAYKDITSVELPATIKYIGNNAFYGTDLVSIDFSKAANLVQIGDYAFKRSHLTSIDLSNCGALESIGTAAFKSNQLVSVDFSNCVLLDAIGDEAFGSNIISSINFSNTSALKQIGNSSFQSNQLASIDLSHCVSLEGIGANAFANNALDAFNLPEPDYAYNFWQDCYGNAYLGNDQVENMIARYAVNINSKYPVVFNIKNGDFAVANAKITLDGYASVYTDNTGIAIVANVAPEENISYTVESEHFASASGSVSVLDASIKETVTVSTVKEPAYSVSFLINGSIPDIWITLAGHPTVYTSYSGVTIDSVSRGKDIEYTVVAHGYDDYHGKLSVINQNVLENIGLAQRTDPVYRVAFNVTSGTYNYIKNAEVTLADYPQVTTDGFGNGTIINVSPGTAMDYTVHALGYADYAGNVSVSAGNVSVDVDLSLDWSNTYTATFNVSDGTNPVSGAVVKLNGYSEATTDATGIASIPHVRPGTEISYTITAEDFYTKIGTLAVLDSDVTEDIVFESSIPPTYTVSFVVTDGSDAIEGAEIKLIGYVSTGTTGENGVATFSDVLPRADIYYSISAKGYDNYFQKISVTDSDVTVNAELVSSTYTVSFSVTDGTNAIDDATVYLGNYNPGITWSFSEGIAMVSRVVPEADIPYTVCAHGYETNSGTVTVDYADVDEAVTLTPAISDLTVSFTVSDGTNPISGAWVDLDGYGLSFTDESGVVTYENVQRNSILGYSIENEGFATIESTIATASADVSKNIAMEQALANLAVSFAVSDGANPVSGAVVTINGYGSKTADATGSVAFDGIMGYSSLGYSVIFEGCEIYSGYLSTYAENIAEEVELSPIEWYTLTDDDVVVDNGIIKSCSYDFSIKNIIIPNYLDGQSVTGIVGSTIYGEGVFGTNSFNSLKLPNSIVSVGTGSFYFSRIYAVDFSACSRLETIGEKAFANNQLVMVDLSECSSLRTIGKDAFTRNNISDLTLPANLETIGETAFNANAIETVNGVASDGLIYAPATDSVPENSVIVSYGGNASELVLSSNVRSIGNDALYFCGLTNVDLSACTQLTYIGTSALAGNEFAEITLPTPSIPGYSFNYWQDEYGSETYAGDSTLAEFFQAYIANLTENQYAIAFTVTDGANPVAGATVSIEGTAYASDSSGIVEADGFKAGFYDYAIVASGYDDVAGFVAIADSDVAVLVEMVASLATTHRATFHVTDGEDPVVGATVTIGEEEYATDSDGVVVVSDLKSGTYDYSITAAGYNDVAGTVTVADADIAEDVEMNRVIVTVLHDTICQNDSYAFGAYAITSPGAYSQTFTSAGGYDSIVNLILAVNPVYATADELTICSGDLPYDYHGNTIAQGTNSGDIEYTFSSECGCDSVVTLSLTVLDHFEVVANAQICQGGTYAFGNQILDEEGTYSETFSSAGGCDSVVTLSLTVVDHFEVEISERIYEGDSYVLGVQTLTESGTYRETFSSTDGCDSMVTVHLHVIEYAPIFDTIHVSICEQDTYVFGDTVLALKGKYSHRFTASNGQDSIVTLLLSVNPAYSINIDEKIAFGESYTMNGNTYTLAGVYTDSLLTASGCDSIITLSISFVQQKVTFNVTTGESAIGGALVEVEDTVLTTNLEGQVSYETSRYGDVPYSVSANGYETFASSYNPTDVQWVEVKLLSVGVADADIADDVELCPNPVADKITVLCNVANYDGIDIYDYRGIKRYSGSISSASTAIDVSNYASGLYMMVLKGTSVCTKVFEKE